MPLSYRNGGAVVGELEYKLSPAKIDEGPAVITGSPSTPFTTLPLAIYASGSGTQNAGKLPLLTLSVPTGAAWTSKVVGPTNWGSGEVIDIVSPGEKWLSDVSSIGTEVEWTGFFPNPSGSLLADTRKDFAVSTVYPVTPPCDPT